MMKMTHRKIKMTRRINERDLLMIINEETELLNEAEIYHKALFAEGRRLELEGYDREIINEGIISMLASIIGHAPSGVVDMFKAKLIRRAQEGLGFNPESFLGRVVANVIEAIKLSQLPDYFGPSKCDMLADMVIDGIAETLVEQPGDRIAASFGFNPKSALWMTFRESITNSLMDEGGIGGKLKTKIKDYVCTLSFKDVVGGLKGGADKVKSGVGGLFGGGAEAAKKASVVVPKYGA